MSEYHQYRKKKKFSNQFLSFSLLLGIEINTLHSFFIDLSLLKMSSLVFNQQWAISTSHGPILVSEGPKRTEYEEKLGTHHLPDMIFDQTSLKLLHQPTQLELQFHAFDALKMIDVHHNPDDIPKVSMSEVWRKSRVQDRELDYVKPYDWTYTTRYQGNPCDGYFRHSNFDSSL